MSLAIMGLQSEVFLENSRRSTDPGLIRPGFSPPETGSTRGRAIWIACGSYNMSILDLLYRRKLKER